MIAFFRKIRHRLLTENRLSKYLLYAIGEILLVVIGILIALQINTWNQEKISKDKEVKVLREIRSDLLSNRTIVQNTIDVLEKTNVRIIQIMDYFDDKLGLSDSIMHLNLEIVRRLRQFEYNEAAYESVKALGFDIIVNDSVRLAVINLYENVYKVNKSYIDANDGESARSLNAEYEQCCPSVNGVIVPEDLVSFRKNRGFYNKLSLRLDWRNYFLVIMRSTLRQTDQVISLLDYELERNP